MTYKIVKLGALISRRNEKNHDDSISRVMGLSTKKEFRKPHKTVNLSRLTNYKVVRENDFAFVPTTDTWKIFASALNKGYGTIVVSPIYETFSVQDPRLIPEFLEMFLKREEFDRYARYNSWGSARENFTFQDLCEVDMPLPPVDKQREYMGIYSNLLMLRNNHEKSFADLQLITDTFTEKLVQKYGTEELDGYIQQTDTRNRDLAVKKVQGISIQKKFIDSKANMDGVPLGGYKVVRPGEFAYVTVTSRNGQKISLALNDGGESYIVSSTYISFTVKDTEKLLPEFLLLWFKRPEFDRYARYNSWGSARETFDWSEMQRVRLPVPPIAVQKSIVAIYHALEARKRLAERLKATIKEISPILIKDARDKVEAVA